MALKLYNRNLNCLFKLQQAAINYDTRTMSQSHARQKLNVLFIGSYNRRDYVDLFLACRDHFNFYFLEYSSEKEIKDDYYKTFGKAIFWKDYRDVNDLLARIKPSWVIFFFIESYLHLVLNLACKANQIPTYLVDHGIRDLAINVRLEKHFVVQQQTSLLTRLITIISQFRSRYQTRVFLKRSAANLPPASAAFFLEFYQTRSKHSFIETIRRLSSPLRLADTYISFSPKFYEVHKYYDNLTDLQKVYFIGHPGYDHLATITPAAPVKQLIFIDQGLNERGLLGWTDAAYQDFVMHFTSASKRAGYKILAKLHPVQTERSKKLWMADGNVDFINDNQLTAALPQTNLIVGFFSTYLLPIAALPHTALVTLENHPAGKLDVSSSFINAGVAHPVYSVEELNWAIKHVHQLHEQQQPHKEQFTKDWMYKFDGKAGERLRDILLGNNI